jgi:hypothetical protein
MKNLLKLAMLFTTLQAMPQVGIGTTTPAASLEIKNTTSETNVLKAQGTDGNTKLLVKENGRVIITPPATDNTVTKVYGLNPTDNSFILLDKKEPTGLERLNEGNGNAWRLIGRNPSFYGPLGAGAVDFSENFSVSSTAGAGTTYSLIGPGYNNTITADQDYGPLNNYIIGGNNNFIGYNSNFNDVGAHILGGDNNIAYSGVGRTFIGGDFNTMGLGSFGIIYGSGNSIGNDSDSVNVSHGFLFGNGNTLEPGAVGTILGSNNVASTTNSQNINIIGTGNITKIPLETIIGNYAENVTTTLPLYPIVSDMDLYNTTTTDVSFRIGIGYKRTNNTIVRKDGFRVYKDGRVEIRQTPVTNNTLTKIYGRDTNGSFSLIDKSSIISESLVEDTSCSTCFTLAYLNTTYSSRPINFNVYALNANRIFTKVASNRWVSQVITIVN